MSGAALVITLLTGCLTYYAEPYVGEPLRCGSVGGASGIYDTTHTWIAVDIDAFPGWYCGDLVRVTVGDDVMLLPILDSGFLNAHCVYYGSTCVPIIGDLPAHAFPWPGLSVRGVIENLTGGLRQVGALDMWNEARQEVER